eukprot:scaffold193105_cov30-Tisochrysis_lutea.AAC.1
MALLLEGRMSRQALSAHTRHPAPRMALLISPDVAALSNSNMRVPRNEGDAHACHALYLAGEVSAALTPAVPRDPSLHEDTWHFSEWPLSARKDAGNGTRGSCALQ